MSAEETVRDERGCTYIVGALTELHGEYWWDRRQRLWVSQLKDAQDFEPHGATCEYAIDKEQAGRNARRQLADFKQENEQ